MKKLLPSYVKGILSFFYKTKLHSKTRKNMQADFKASFESGFCVICLNQSSSVIKYEFKYDIHYNVFHELSAQIKNKQISSYCPSRIRNSFLTEIYTVNSTFMSVQITSG